MSLQNLSPACRPDNLRCTKDPAFTHKSVEFHTLRTTARTAFKRPINSQIRRRACPSDPHLTHDHIFTILHPVRLASSVRILPTISCQFYSCVGVIGSIFVCASWGLRVRDRVISVVAHQTTQHRTARAGGLHSKWTGGTACTPKQCIAIARSRIAPRLDPQRCLKLCQLARSLPDAT